MGGVKSTQKDHVEEALKQQGYVVVEKEGRKLLVKSKEDKRFLVKQIEKDEHVEECLKRPDHVHIVEKQLFEENGETYLLMEQCSGGTLNDKIQAHKEDNETFSEEQVMVWLTKMCMALEHLHTDGIAHRLLISQNIFFTGCGTLRLGETAELHERAGLEKPKHTKGNQPPEVREGRPYTIHSDVYALGCLLYEMCTLETCVRLNTDLISSIRRGSKDFLINFSSDLRSLLADMLHPDPECRPSVSDILKRTHQYPDQMRIVLLGRTGDGKSSSGNTILGHKTGEKFGINSSPNSVTSECKGLTGIRPGKETNIQIIDTPGFYHTQRSESELLPEILKCITLSAPGPHAFIIVLRVERYTEQDIATVAEITRSFGEDAFKYSVVLFTHGDQLNEVQTIEQFVEQIKELKELVEKCGGRCHVIDNKYWNQEEHGYRSNRVQVEKMLNTIEEMVRKNGGDCYTNEMLQAVEEALKREEEEIRNETTFFNKIKNECK